MSSPSVNLFSYNLPAPESTLAPGSIPLILAETLNPLVAELFRQKFDLL